MGLGSGKILQMALRSFSVLIAALTFLAAPRGWALECEEVSPPPLPSKVDASWEDATGTATQEREILTGMFSRMNRCVAVAKGMMKSNLAKAQALETQSKERQTLQGQQRAATADSSQLDAAGLAAKNQEMSAGLDQDIANRVPIQNSLDESRVPLDKARQWEAAISQRLDKLQGLHDRTQKSFLDPAWAAHKSAAAQSGTFQGMADWAMQNTGTSWNYPGVYSGENQPTLELSHKRINAVQTQNNNLQTEITNKRENLARNGKDDRAGFAKLMDTDYRSVLGGHADAAAIEEAGNAKGELDAAYNESASLSRYASVMNADALDAKAELAKVGATGVALSTPDSANVSPAPTSSGGGGGGKSGGGGGGGGASPAAAAAPTTAAAPSPTPSFQKKSSMPGWVLPVGALVVGGVGGYLVGKSAAKSSDSSSGTKSSTSGSATGSSSGESASAKTTSSGSSAATTSTSTSTEKPVTQATAEVQTAQQVPAETPVQTATVTNDTRRISVSSSASTKKSWKGLQCPEAVPVESYNPVVINTNKAMTDLRNQCLAEGGRP